MQTHKNITLDGIVDGYFKDKDLAVLIEEAKQKGDEALKHGKNPTRAQKDIMKNLDLNYKEWLVVKDTPDALEIVNRDTGSIVSHSK